MHLTPLILTTILAVALSAAPVRADDVDESEEQKVEKRLEKEVRERHDRAEKKQKSYEHTERRKHEKTGKDGSRDKAKQEREGRPMDSKGKSTEMLERRDERKAIKGAYDEEVAGGAERVKGKKPWWKFWGGDED